MIIALQVTERPQKKEIHFAVMAAFHVPGERSQIRQVSRLSVCNDNCPSGYRKTPKEGNPFCCYGCIPCPQGEITNQTIGMLVLDMLPRSVCKISFSKCTNSDSSPFLHKYHELGDFTLGGIISQSFIVSEKITLRRHPFQDIFFSFDDNGEFVRGFNIINWVTFPNQSFLRVKVGSIDQDGLSQHLLNISEDNIIWPSWFNQVLPLSLCNDNCPSGYRRTPNEGKPFCCYDCIPCPEGKITNQTDMDQCFQCSEHQYPNNKKNFCLLKSVCKVSFSKCTNSDPSSVPHKFHEPGDFILGGIISNSFVVSEKISFRRHPFQDIFLEYIKTHFCSSVVLSNKIFYGIIFLFSSEYEAAIGPKGKSCNNKMSVIEF
ncbi:hypothetical protein E2320_003427 [Naja naja]|nr:hypothetical protein E2320_003427 [Naja naja]